MAPQKMHSRIERLSHRFLPFRATIGLVSTDEEHSKEAEIQRKVRAATEAAIGPIRAQTEAAGRAMERNADAWSRIAEESTRPIRDAAEALAKRKQNDDERQERMVRALESGNLATGRQFRWTFVVAIFGLGIAIAGLVVALVR
jgi:hypothetical protein